MAYSYGNPGAGITHNLYIATSPDLQKWTALVTLNLGASSANNFMDVPNWVVDPSGHIHIVYIEDDGHWVREIHPNSQDPSTWGTAANWSTPVTVTGPGSANLSQGNTFVTCRLGGSCYMGFDPVGGGTADCTSGHYCTRTSSGLTSGWSAAADSNASTSYTGGDVENLSILPSGVFRWYFTSGNNHLFKIYYIESADFSSWTTPTQVNFLGAQHNNMNWAQVVPLKQISTAVPRGARQQ
jgi:hypothetical protein